MPATELGARVVREVPQRAGLSGDKIGTVVMGDVIQAGNRMNPARQASVGGGPYVVEEAYPLDVPLAPKSFAVSELRP